MNWFAWVESGLTVRSSRLLVVDASVAVKWYLDDETHVAEARKVLGDFVAGRVELLAPSHIRFEVPAAISVACRRGRIGEDGGRQAINDFLSWEIEMVDRNQLLRDAFDTARRLGCAFYDGLYLALAEAAGCQFVYADSRLRDQIRNVASYAVWIGHYDSGSV